MAAMELVRGGGDPGHLPAPALPDRSAAVAALVVRFRRSRGIEGQQLKWFTCAAALAPLPFLV
jgi:hypothetical protein